MTALKWACSMCLQTCLYTLMYMYMYESTHLAVKKREGKTKAIQTTTAAAAMMAV